jgi:hypothetical protein
MNESKNQRARDKVKKPYIQRACRWPGRSKFMAGAILVFLLLVAGGAGPVAATPSDGTNLAPTAGVTSAPAASNGSSWLRIRLNLSGSPSITSGFPDIATDSSGNYVAVVWSDGYSSAPEAKWNGHVYLRWISENTGTWSSKITVDHGTSTATDYASKPAVALQNTSGTVTAHIVWVRWEQYFGYKVWYRACVLGGSCGSVTMLKSADANPVDSPDIAADDSGRVFAVWMRQAGDDQAIDYAEFNGSTWSPTEEISDSGTDNDWPAVAVRGSTAYTAWIRKTVGGEGKVVHRRKTIGGAWLDAAWASVYTFSDSRNPVLATGSSAVYLAWETEVADPDFRVNYKHNAGSGWQPSPTNERKTITDTCRATTSSAVEEYRQYLRPALASWGSRLYAVWQQTHSVGEGEYIRRVLYSYSDNPDTSNPWSAPVVFAELGGNEDLSPEERHFPVDNVAPGIAVGPPQGTETEPHLHVVLMLRTGSAWDVWYLSNEFYKSVSLPIVAKNY